jgi:hypothetical protein
MSCDLPSPPAFVRSISGSHSHFFSSTFSLRKLLRELPPRDAMTVTQRAMVERVLLTAFDCSVAVDRLNSHLMRGPVGHWTPQRSAWEIALQKHEQQAQRSLDELHTAFALPELERATGLLPELVGIIGEFLSADSRPAEYVSIHALPKAAHQQQQQPQPNAFIAAHSS